MNYYPRTSSEVVAEATKTFKCLLISGPRQVGKTTLLKAADPNRRYVTLDDPEIRALARRDPPLFLQTYPDPLLIDEVQYAPELFPYIKIAVDKSEATGQYWLTGSQQYRLMQNVTESLAGRIAILNLCGLSWRELRGDPSPAPFIPDRDALAAANQPERKLSLAAAFDRIVQGGFPHLHAIPGTDRTLYLSSYVATYLERDVRQIVNIVNEGAFSTFLKIVAARTGQLLNYNSIAQVVGVKAPTVKAWMSVLETAGLVSILRPFKNNLTKRATATPKCYFLDTALACHLCGLRTAEEAMRSPLNGALFETAVITEILKSFYHAGRSPDLTFYRDKEGAEIDLLINQDGMLHPIEVKQAAAPDWSAIRKNFAAFEKTGNRLGSGAVICLCEESLPFDANITRLNAGVLQ